MGVEVGLYALGCLAVGSIPFALLLGRAHGVDIRSLGSGNVGATNLSRALGIRWGIIAFLLDAAKGAGPVWWGASRFAEHSWVPVVGGALTVVGHCFSPYLAFRGGKGVATTGGVVLALDPWIFLLLGGTWLVVVLWIRNVGVASSACAVLALGLGLALLLSVPGLPTAWGEGGTALGAFLVALSLLVLVRHRRNLASFLDSRHGAGS